MKIVRWRAGQALNTTCVQYKSSVSHMLHSLAVSVCLQHCFWAICCGCSHSPRELANIYCYEVYPFFSLSLCMLNRVFDDLIP